MTAAALIAAARATWPDAAHVLESQEYTIPAVLVQLASGLCFELSHDGHGYVANAPLGDPAGYGETPALALAGWLAQE
jgi:hypothetical protein